MKKVLIFITLVMMLCLCLSSVCLASEVEAGVDKTELEIYITEKVAPVVVGVLTSVFALITTLGSIAKSLRGLKDTKSTFEIEAQDRKDAFKSNTELLESRVQEIKETVEDVPELKGQIEKLEGEVTVLIDECRLLAEILSLGFSASSEIIKSGKGKKMALLLENAKSKVTQNEKN